MFFHSGAMHVLQELRFGSQDIEIKSHIDARTLDFTAAPYAAESETDCDKGRGKPERGCGYLEYMHYARSIRVRCFFLVKRLSQPLSSPTLPTYHISVRL